MHRLLRIYNRGRTLAASSARPSDAWKSFRFAARGSPTETAVTTEAPPTVTTRSKPSPRKTAAEAKAASSAPG